MDDYKELVQRLHRHIMGDDYFNINSDFASAVVQAADAIEQLVKERDAAINAIPHNCFTCKKFPTFHKDGLENDFCNKCYRSGYCNWGWRGASE